MYVTYADDSSNSNYPTTYIYDYSEANAEATTAIGVLNQHFEVRNEETDTLPVFVNKLKPGSLAIEKRVQGESDDPSQEFTFHVKLTGDNVEPDAAYEYDLEQVQATGFGGGTAGKAASRIGNPIDLLIGLFTPTTAYAATDWQQYTDFDSSIEWMVDDDGVLTIRPISGTEGALTLSDDNGYPSDPAPWSAQKRNIKSVVVSDGCTIKCKNSIKGLFFECSNMTSVDLSRFDTSEATNMAYMFGKCSKLTSLDVSGLDTSSVTNMS